MNQRIDTFLSSKSTYKKTKTFIDLKAARKPVKPVTPAINI